MIYLICFFASAVFAYLAHKTNSRGLFVFLSVVSILITTCLAGFRGITVGIDTANYFSIARFWPGAVGSSSIIGYMQLYVRASRGTQELLFGLLTGLVAKLTANYNVFLFICHLIIVGGVYIGASRLKEHADPAITMLLFYLLYFNHSLNVFRQYCAMAIIFAVVADLEKKKYFKYLVFVVIAFFFHNTAVIGIAPLLIHMVLYPRSSLREISLGRKAFTLVAIVGGTASILPVVRLLINAGVLSSKYLYYLDSEDSSYTMVLLFLMVELTGIALCWKYLKKNDAHFDFFLLCSGAFLVLYILATSVKYGKRIAAYFSFLNIITLGMMIKTQPNINNRRIARLAVFGVVLVYWVYVYMYRNASQTFPYVLGF